ncbi:MaoC family dehydratase [Runella slithyformis]|uniref:Enoyl-CoA hydratase n=1 Tax=Runella slithyformis (strain ATCC 29530 / DSM 19594 / LMG 11500 / NCIMB 11436 / LSU 4) TaxID=761193 RepID=A0A7U3ZK05_RUNSL|nr:MaoC family dehydratase [Runella slithyformis]AEI48646.1 Enoyl-CoA hydratase [Runella slithyformis DSM 19594]
MLTFDTLAAFRAHVGQSLGTSEWVTITQDMVNDFAKATGDDQWIHVNAEMAKLSPFKTTIAHGFLTLSLAPKCMYGMYRVKSVKMGLNYGTNKVRFTSPVPTGSRVRMHAVLKEVEDQANGIKSVVEAVFELEGSAKPACVAELITLMFE